MSNDNNQSTKRKSYEQFRSFQWFGKPDLRSFGHRSRAMQIGHDAEDWIGKPVIGILNTWSEINQCHSHFKDRVEWIKKAFYRPEVFLSSNRL